MKVRYLDVVPRVPVTDLRGMVEFYRATFGFAVEMIWPDDNPSFAILERDDAELQFYVADDPTKCGAVMLNLEVTDATSVHAELSGRLAIEWGPEVYWYGRREFALRDPEGNLVIITEATDDPPTSEEDA